MILLLLNVLKIKLYYCTFLSRIWMHNVSDVLTFSTNLVYALYIPSIEHYILYMFDIHTTGYYHYLHVCLYRVLWCGVDETATPSWPWRNYGVEYLYEYWLWTIPISHVYGDYHSRDYRWIIKILHSYWQQKFEIGAGSCFWSSFAQFWRYDQSSDSFEFAMISLITLNR